MSARAQRATLFAALFAVTLALRLCHLHLLWADEDYHLAAGLATLRGHMLYRDLWYDKPPLAAWLYACLGGLAGWPLRLFDALYILAICGAVWRFARDLWGERQGLIAAALMGFFLNFDFSPAILPIASDFFLLLPHLLAVHCAWKGKPLAAGLWCGVAFLFHAKGLFVLATCTLLAWRSLPLLLLGFAIPNSAAFGILALGGALPDYFRQVWQWGAAYTASSPELHPWANGLRRTLDWLGFHAALAVGSVAFWWGAGRWGARKRDSYWMIAWLLLSFGGVMLGARFFPRYYLQLLPAVVLMASQGWERRKFCTLAATLLLLIPLARFGPRYALLANDVFHGRQTQWADVALDQDSRAAAALVIGSAGPGDTLFVWGYRPGIFVYTRLPMGSRFWDSQPLTGVPADRHLRDDTAVLPEQAARHRAELAASRPTWVVDSLSLSNPRLALTGYGELRPWLAQYRLVARTSLSLIYRRLPEEEFGAALDGAGSGYPGQRR